MKKVKKVLSAVLVGLSAADAECCSPSIRCGRPV